jgi:cobyrinic acid a,c-diamide synthase
VGSARLVIAGLSGDSGKTIASLSILSALRPLRRKGYSVSAFKKGPDFIDPAWLSLASQSVCRNLDTYLVDPGVVLETFVRESEESEISVVEGNRGLFDSRDEYGSHSTAELAKLLQAPVVLIANATKVTRTIAAIIKGCVDFDPAVNIAGVILNRVAGKRHLRILSDSIARWTGLPVLGAIPRLGEDSTLIPGRHLGLVTPAEYEGDEDLQATLRKMAEEFLDIDALIELAKSAPPLSGVCPAERPMKAQNVRVGYFKDPVFTFYYPENLEALRTNGARLVEISSLADGALPEVDALYIGGGFPETHAEQLAKNRALMKSIEQHARNGLPIYAECGGLMYLCRSLRWDTVVYPMTGLFPVDLSMHERPVGHGYTSLRIDAPNPFYPVGTSIRGHEFHYSGSVAGALNAESCMQVEIGTGLGSGRDGMVRFNTLACYTHIHADGTDSWAPALVSTAAEFASKRRADDNKNNSKGGWLESEAV